MLGHASAADAAPGSAPEQLKVAFVLSPKANVMDFAGAWEVFQDAMVDNRMPFQLFTVAESTTPITASGGLQVVPNYSFSNAPHPDIVVIGAQKGSPGLSEWLRARAKDSKVVMSVCTGAFKLAEAGLLTGKKATTHHDYLDSFASKFPKVQLQRDVRFIQSDDVVFTAAGITSGIDLALHIVERFYGREAAEGAAREMEYHRVTTSAVAAANSEAK
jgi:transcriptional regulator GlxA family with amidase domain